MPEFCPELIANDPHPPFLFHMGFAPIEKTLAGHAMTEKVHREQIIILFFQKGSDRRYLTWTAAHQNRSAALQIPLNRPIRAGTIGLKILTSAVLPRIQRAAWTSGASRQKQPRKQCPHPQAPFGQTCRTCPRSSWKTGVLYPKNTRQTRFDGIPRELPYPFSMDKPLHTVRILCREKGWQQETKNHKHLLS